MSHSRKITPTADDISNDLRNSQSETSARLSLYNSQSLISDQAWFHISQPMTRSRSSELRHTERKKLGNQIEKEKVGDSSNALYHAQGINSAFDKRRGNGIHEIPPGSFQEISPGQVKDPEFSRTGRSRPYGSIKSAGSVDKGDPTKKRRVERSRKMAEAKERNMTPATPSDMQSVLKRCENLEKEVRSLKLNLSFMNRKDSEQTKEIEDLQKQNDDLSDEKERLLEEIERILAETENM
uniref:Uncharacterized protein n=1 Tax=Salix viminalis TaxID=40686 RepID=A0A6N2NKM1_SALVM